VIVVGIDGSEAAGDALRWALAEARLRGAAVRAVHVWAIPAAVVGPAFVAPVSIDIVPELRDSADALLKRVVGEALGDATDVDVERVVAEGAPTAILVEEAESAELLVVGSRGLGGFRGLLLGSVSQQCAHHAPCPVVIVRHSEP
jgi:nucleotide-binding universal stress UspA family protein